MSTLVRRPWYFGGMAFASRAFRLSLLALLLLVRPAVAPASAELVLLTTGRTLAISGHEFEGDRVVLHLPNGGQIVCDRSLIVRIEADYAPPPPVERLAETIVPPAPVRPFAEIIDAASVRHGVDSALLFALIEVESSYKPNAVSAKGAMGLMQLMPATAHQYAVADPYNPSDNVEAGTKHLRSLLDRYDVHAALAAYNAGEGSVRKFGGVPPFPETRRYVTKILELADVEHD
ncbi:MAG: lytic transglycosylase domain-containing protein [bacterium]